MIEIPNYRLRKECGRGAFGEVWLAEDPAGRLVALKTVEKSDQAVKELEGLRCFSRSGDSSGLIRIFHIGELGSMLYYTMEPADNLNASADDYSPATLGGLLARKKHFSPGEIHRIALELLQGLKTLHASGLIHRDIKPENILFIGGKAKLSDMGLVRSLDHTLSLGGTLGFIPPERLRSSSTGKTSADDLYALGKVLYCMMTGNDPEKYPSVPPELMDEPEARTLNRIIKTACCRDAVCRFRTADEFIAALNTGIPKRKRVFELLFNLRFVFLFILLCAVLAGIYRLLPPRTEIVTVERKVPQETAAPAIRLRPPGETIVQPAPEKEEELLEFAARIRMKHGVSAVLISAKDISEARKKVKEQFPDSRVFSVNPVSGSSGFSEYEVLAALNGRTPFRETVRTTSLTKAKELILQKHPGAKIQSVRLLPSRQTPMEPPKN